MVMNVTNKFMTSSIFVKTIFITTFVLVTRRASNLVFHSVFSIEATAINNIFVEEDFGNVL